MDALRFDVEHFLAALTPMIDIKAVVPLVLDYCFASEKIISFATFSSASDIQWNTLPAPAILAEVILSKLIFKCERTLIALELLLVHSVANVHINMLCTDEGFMTTPAVLVIASAYAITAGKLIAGSALNCIFDD